MFNLIIVENSCFLFGVHIYFWVVGWSLILNKLFNQFMLFNISIKFSIDVLSLQDYFIGCLQTCHEAWIRGLDTTMYGTAVQAGCHGDETFQAVMRPGYHQVLDCSAGWLSWR